MNTWIMRDEWMLLVYFIIGAVVSFGARFCRGGWNEEATGLAQSKVLQGIAILGIALHHMAQKTCAPWHSPAYIVHGLDFFVPIGFLFVGIFLFCSGLGLYKSWKTKPDYLHGFPRRRILPMVIAFYLSEIIHLLLRLAMGESMTALDVVWYLSGLHMANVNAWYIIVIPFFYLAFWLAFRHCKREGAAIGWVTLFILAYTLLGAWLGHPEGWWMRGEWWYNSAILFPLGLLFGKYETRVTAVIRKGYWVWLLLSLAAMIGLYRLSVLASESWWGYYGENWHDPLEFVHRLGSCAAQWLACLGTVFFCLVFMQKVKLGNGLLALMGKVTLSFYLMHGIFVELFGFNFLDFTRSVVYIKQVPLYMLTVLACSVPATALFHLAWKGLTRLTAPRELPR